jgi:hypothetical protein
MANFVGKPLLVYLDDTIQADLDLLAPQVDGFLLRGVKNVYDTKVVPGQNILNSDAWKLESDAMRVDGKYAERYDAIRAQWPNKPIYMVIEGNPAIDRNMYEPHDTNLLSQFTVIRNAVQTTRYLPDVFLLKIVDYQWWENGKLTTCTEVNFSVCYNFLIPLIVNKYHKETEIWSSAPWIKVNRPAFINTLDTWNNPQFGGPHYPVAFSYYHPSVPNGRTLTDLHSVLAELQDPSGLTEFGPTSPYAQWNAQPLKGFYLTAGSFSGADLPNVGSAGSYGLWGFDQNNFFNGVTDLAGKPKALELFTHYLPVDAWKEYIMFNGGSEPPADTIPPSAPTNLQVDEIKARSVSLRWQPATDNVAVDHYIVYRDGGVQFSDINIAPACVDLTVEPETTYTYSIVAVDAAGNMSPHSADVTVTTLKDGGVPPADTDLIEAIVRLTDQVKEVNTNLSIITGQNTDILAILTRVFGAASSDGLTFRKE